jgi:hypothetical protein
MAEEINKNSSEFILGQILTRLESGDKAFNAFTMALDTLRGAVSQMPCITHTQQIASIIKWQSECKEEQSTNKRTQVEFKNVIIGGLLIAFASSALTYGITKIFGG